MPQHQHINLPFGANRDSVIAEWFGKQIKDIGLDFDRGILFIAASDSRARFVKHQLAAALPEGHFGTIDGVMARLVARVTLPGPVAPSAVAREHLRLAAMQVLEASGNSIRPSRLWIDQIATALDRVALCWAPQDRDAELQRLEIEARKAGDAGLEERLIFLREIQEHYQEGLQAAGLVDEADLEWLFISRIGQALAGVKAVFIDDIYRLAPAQRAFLDACANSGKVEMTILTRSSDADSLNEVTAASIGEWLPKSFVREDLAPPPSTTPEPLFACGVSQRQEARMVTRRVKALANEGVELSDIGVSMVTQDQQKKIITELEFNGVPVCSHGEVPLTQMPLVDGVLALLRVLSEGAERERTMAALRSPWLRGLEAITRPAFEGEKFVPSWFAFVENLTVLARKALIVGGVAGQGLKEVWAKRFSDLAERIQNPKNAEDAKQLKYSGLSERDLPRITAAQSLIETLDKLLRGPRQELLDRVLTFVESLDLGNTLYSVAKRARLGEVSQRRIHAISLDQFRQTLASFARVDAQFGGNEPTSLHALLEDIEDELKSVFVRPRKDVEGVFVGGLLDAREMDFTHQIIGGLYDGELPFNTPENLYLPSRIREIAGHLSENQREALGGESAPLAIYRHLFASAAIASRESILLTMPRAVDGGEVETSVPFREFMEGNAVSAKDFLESVKQEGAAKELLGNADAQAALAENFTTDPPSAGEFQRPWLSGAMQGLAANALRSDVNVLASSFEGHLEGHANELAQRYKPEGEVPFISNSSLETYAGCPLKYYFREVLGLEEEERPKDEISPMDRGSLVHNALEAFLLEVRRVIHESGKGQYLDAGEVEAPKGTDLKTLPLLDLKLYEELSGTTPRDLLRKEFAAKAADYPFPSTSWQQWLERIDDSLKLGASVNSELSLFLQFEEGGQERGVMPWLLEYSFGDVDDEASGPSYKIDDLDGKPRMQIRGFIDRVDVLRNEESEPKGFVVRDYKVSRASKKSELLAGTRFQLPIYAAAVGEHFEGLANAGFFYHLLTLANVSTIDAPVMPEDTLAALKGPSRSKTVPPALLAPPVIAERIATIEGSMEAGHFHPALVLGEKSCEYCNFARMCAKRPIKVLAHNQSLDLLHAQGAYVPSLLSLAKKDDDVKE